MAGAHNKKSKKGAEKLIVVLLVCVVLLFLVNGGWAQINQWRIKTTVIGSAEETVLYETYGLASVSQYLMTPTVGGEGYPVTEEGQRVARNHAVFRVISPSGSAMQNEDEKFYYAPLAGLVSYHIDGYEEITDPVAIAALDLEALYKEEQAGRPVVGTAATDKPFAKIINNLKPITLTCLLADNDYTAAWTVDENVKIFFPDFDYRRTGKVVSLTEVDGQKAAQIDIGVPIQTLYSQRVLKMQFSYTRPRVIQLPAEAVVYREGLPGVYYVENDFVFWRDIVVTVQDHELVTVQELPEGTEVILTPQRVAEGENIR